MINIVTGPGGGCLYQVQYTGSHGAPCERCLEMTHKSLWALISEKHDWLFRVWSMKALTADGSKWCALSIDNHSLAGEKNVYLLDCRRHLFDSQVMELSFFLFQIKIISPSSFLPSIFCHIKRVINSARWRHHYWNNLTVSFLLLLPTESASTIPKPIPSLASTSVSFSDSWYLPLASHEILNFRNALSTNLLVFH